MPMAKSAHATPMTAEQQFVLWFNLVGHHDLALMTDTTLVSAAPSESTFQSAIAPVATSTATPIFN
jgi:hypothetical protein